MDHAGHGSARDADLGPIVAKVQGQFARGEMPTGAYLKAPLSLIGRVVRMLAGNFARRGHRPSPFFDPATGKPVVTPLVLTPEQRQQLRVSAGFA